MFGVAVGFSSDEKICGTYYDNNEHLRPIVWTSSGCVYTSVNFPTGTQGVALGFSSSGQICGHYVDDEDINHHIVWTSD